MFLHSQIRSENAGPDIISVTVDVLKMFEPISRQSNGGIILTWLQIPVKSNRSGILRLVLTICTSLKKLLGGSDQRFSFLLLTLPLKVFHSIIRCNAIGLTSPGYYVNVCYKHFSAGCPTRQCPNPDLIKTNDALIGKQAGLNRSVPRWLPISRSLGL